MTTQPSASEVARQVAHALIDSEGTASAWDLGLEEAREGYARVRMRVRTDMLNGHRTAHGGMIFALADSAFAYACNSRNRAAVAQQASIIFLSPAQIDEVLVAEAREVALNGRSGAYEVLIRTDDGRAVAHFQGLSRIVGDEIVKTEKT
jgi:acyl-CoA thioesterase